MCVYMCVSVYYIYVASGLVTRDVMQNILRSRNLPYLQPERDGEKITDICVVIKGVLVFLGGFSPSLYYSVKILT